MAASGSFCLLLTRDLDVPDLLNPSLFQFFIMVLTRNRESSISFFWEVYLRDAGVIRVILRYTWPGEAGVPIKLALEVCVTLLLGSNSQLFL